MYPGSDDRTGGLSIAAGLVAENVGRAIAFEPLVVFDHLAVLAGSLLYAYLLFGVFASR